MKRKININIWTLSALVTLLVAVFLLGTFYNFHVENEIKALKEYGNIMSEIMLPLEEMKTESLREKTDSNIRLTIINLDGDVLFDSIAEAETMENHLDRLEVQDALEFGEGESIRNSRTLGKDTYYYAKLLTNDSILRISRQSNTILSHFTKMLPFVFLVLFLILLLSLFTSSVLTKKIIKPVENAVKNMDKSKKNKKDEDLDIYEEIRPFIIKMKDQEKEISDNMESLEEKAALMNVISSSMEEGLILLDENKKILSTNLSGVQLLKGDESRSYYGEDFIKLSRNSKIYKTLEKSIATNSSYKTVLDYGEKHLNIYINPVLSNDRLVGLVMLVVDSTKKYKLDMMRKEFSANVSHELKTPLTSINGYAEMIENGMVKDEDIKKFAGTIKNEGTRLLNLIDSIIKLSKIEEGGHDEDFEPINLYDIGERVVKSLSFIADEKNIKLNLTGQPTFINGSPSMIEELLYNLIDNGIKYTNSGGKVSLEIKSQEDLSIIKVKDTGIGINYDEQSRIFERFYIVDKSRSKNKTSTGLGLSIVKHIVEKHNGEIELFSEPNKGTEIIIKIRNEIRNDYYKNRTK